MGLDRRTHGSGNYSLAYAGKSVPQSNENSLSFPELLLTGIHAGGFAPQFRGDAKDFRWEDIQEVLDCTLLAPLDFRATYEGEKARKEFFRETMHIFVARNFYMYEKNLLALQADVKWNRNSGKRVYSSAGSTRQCMKKTISKTYDILKAAESGDWGPAKQLLARMSAGGLALLKRYHVEDKGPYPAAYARRRYDE